MIRFCKSTTRSGSPSTQKLAACSQCLPASSCCCCDGREAGFKALEKASVTGETLGFSGRCAASIVTTGLVVWGRRVSLGA